MITTDFYDEIQSSILTDKTQEKIKDKCNYFLFGFEWLSAKIVTNAGDKEINAKSNRFTEFSGIIANKEPFFINWKGATKIKAIDKEVEVNKIGGSRYETSFDKENAHFIKVELVKDEGELQFQTFNFGGFGDNVQLNSEKEIKLRSLTKITKELLINLLYVFPTPNGDRQYDDNYVYRISGYTNYEDAEGNFVYSDITLSSINTTDLTSGRAYESHILFNTPGIGYYFPKLIFKNENDETNNDIINNYPIDFTYNKNLIKDIGVQQIQHEITGLAGFFSQITLGYPLIKLNTNNNAILPPRQLFVQDFKLPISSDYLKGKIKSNKYDFLDANFDARTNFDAWREKKKIMAGENKILRYQGLIESNYGSRGASKGNINDDGNSLNSLFLKLLGTTNSGIIQTKDLGDFYDGKDINNPESEIIGIGEFDLNKMTRKNFTDLFNFYSLFNKNLVILPIESSESTLYSWGQIWGIGKFLNKLDISPSYNFRKIRNNTTELFPKLGKIPMLIDAHAYDFFSRTLLGTNVEGQQKGSIPIEIFDKEANQQLGLLYGNDSTITPLSFTLTDKLTLEKWNLKTKKSVGYETCSSIMIDQTITENGIKYKFKIGQYTQFLNNKTIPKYTDYVGDGAYVITHNAIQQLGNGDIRTTFYDFDLDYVDNGEIKNHILYQRTGKTESQFNSNDLRAILTGGSTNATDLIIKNQGEFNWPITLTKPEPEIDIKNININLKPEKWLNESRKGTTTGFIDYSGEILLYDFFNLGLPTIEQIKLNYDQILIPKNFVNGFLHYDANLGGEFNNIVSKDEITTIKNNIILKVKDIPELVNDNYLDYFELPTIRHRYEFESKGILDLSFYFNIYFNGTKLYLRWWGKWKLDVPTGFIFPTGYYVKQGTAQIEVSENKQIVITPIK